MSSDPRRDADQPEPTWTETTTGERRIEIHRELDALAPLPVLPTEEERAKNPNAVLAFMLACATCSRSDSSTTQAKLEQAADGVERLTAEVDELRGGVIRIDGRLVRADERLARLEDRTETIADAQIAQSARMEKLERKVDHVRITAEGALTNFNGRLRSVEDRVDSLDRRFLAFEELIRADLEVRRREVDAATPTPRSAGSVDHASGDAGGAATDPGTEPDR